MKRILALLLLLVSAASQAATKVEQVRLAAASDITRVVFHLSASSTYKLFSLPNPNRVVVDIADARFATSLAGVDFTGSAVKTLRTGPRDGGALRIVLEVNGKPKPKSFILQPSEGQGYRLVVDLESPGVVNQAQAVPSPLPTPVTVPVVNATPNVAAAPPVENMAASPVPANNADETLRDLVIAIDAGHGGVDPGAIGPRGTQEKDVVLAISRQLESLIRAEPGMRPVMVRDGDYFVRLRDRVNKARDGKADLLISIHADAVNERSAKGSSVYVLSSRGASSEAARWLAEKENASDLVGGVSLDDKDGVLKSVLLDLSQTASIEASLTAGGQVLRYLKDVNQLHRHRVEQAGFVVLKAPDIPSMLVETAFISNPDEERKLGSAAHQRQLALAILSGVKDYFRTHAPPGTKLALWNSSRQHVVARGDTLSGIADRYGISIAQLRVSNKISGDRLPLGGVLRIPSSDGT
ncbi:MAG: N-acetylmuramoyl-L-alanine amidase [Pseudomonadota bacterium]